MSMFIALVLEHGELPESLSGGPSIGKSLASYLDTLDEMARDLSLRPLNDFVVDYTEQIEDILVDEDIEDVEEAIMGLGGSGPWYDPEEGIRTVQCLIQHIDGLLADEDKALEGPLVVLKSLASELDYAKQQDSRFHLSFEG